VCPFAKDAQSFEPHPPPRLWPRPFTALSKVLFSLITLVLCATYHPLGAKRGEEVTVKGWVKTARGQKKNTFIEINDGSTIQNIQVPFILLISFKLIVFVNYFEVVILIGCGGIK
jgi:hypothetical protein